MKKLIMIVFLVLSYPTWAHHSKEHTMLMESPEQVIADTQQGAYDPGFTIIWLVVVIFFVLGALRLIRKK